MSLDDSQTLVLNADYRPVSYFPLSLWSWRDAVQAVFSDRLAARAEELEPRARGAFEHSHFKEEIRYCFQFHVSTSPEQPMQASLS